MELHEKISPQHGLNLKMLDRQASANLTELPGLSCSLKMSTICGHRYQLRKSPAYLSSPTAYLTPDCKRDLS